MTGAAVPPLRVAYSDKLLRWTGSPSSPVRAQLAVRWLAEALPHAVEVMEPALDEAVWDRAMRVHDRAYVNDVRRGYSSEWAGCDKVQGETAGLMLAGTLGLWDWVDPGEPSVSFAPQGAKHHAHHAWSSGFCVLNDMAVVAQEAADAGLRVAYLDWDVHHGDGVEALTRDHDRILTASIHGAGFPGTGQEGHDREHHVYNFMLEDGQGDMELHRAVQRAFHLMNDFEPHLILLAAGADGHANDPLGSLRYSVSGLARAGARVGVWAGLRGLSVIVGGAGGYQPFDHTPAIWASTVAALYNGHTNAVRKRLFA